jgi:hypothetical protein
MTGREARSLIVDVLGTAVGTAAPGPVLAQLRAFLVDLAPAPSADRELALAPGENGLDLLDGGQVVRRGIAPDLGAATVVWRLNAIAGESRDHVLLHAACVAGPRGGGVLLVGGSGAGKSTLAAACVGAGLAYLSDEVAAIDPRTGLVAPYARPLGLDHERLVPASSLGSVAPSPAAPVALVFPCYDPGADTSLVRLDPGWGLAALASHATNVGALGSTALAWLAGLALTAPAFQLTHADAGQAASLITRAAGRPGRPAHPAPVLDPITADTTTVAVGDALAVLHRPTGRIHMLNAAAADVWRRAAADGSAGSRPDWSTAAATIDQLARCGLLVAPGH